MPALLLGETGSDPIEDRLRETVRATIGALFDEELAAFLGRLRYGRDGARKGYRHGRRERELVGTFGAQTVSVPRARIEGEDGTTTELRSKALPRYQRLTKRAEAPIAAVYLAGTDTRRVKRALYGLFQGAVGKDVVGRAWRKVKVDWGAWCAQPRRGGHRSSDPRRHGDPDPAGQEGHQHLRAGRHRRAPRRAEDPAVHPAHGWGEHCGPAPFGRLSRPRSALTSMISTPAGCGAPTS